jgi:hypothetical protein
MPNRTLRAMAVKHKTDIDTVESAWKKGKEMASHYAKEGSKGYYKAAMANTEKLVRKGKKDA